MHKWSTSSQRCKGSSSAACIPRTSCPVKGGHTAVLHLLQADGDVNQGDQNGTPLDRAVQEQHEQHADVFRLLDAPADGTPQDVNAMPLFTTFQSLGHTVCPKHHHVVSGQIGGTNICTLMNVSKFVGLETADLHRGKGSTTL